MISPLSLTAGNAALLSLLATTLLSLSSAAVVETRKEDNTNEQAVPPKALPQAATPADLKWQPALDFDTDGCYNVPAIDKEGNLAQGLPVNNSPGGDSRNCRDKSDLDNNNVYARRACNKGWCAHFYDYYFEKDAGAWVGGHRHDWEHIIVWVKNDKAEYVSVSQHGDYDTRKASDVRWHDSTHPKVVYHKDEPSTHCFRFAVAKDDKIENHTGKWFFGAVVSWNQWIKVAPYSVRDKLVKANFGSAHIGIELGALKGQVAKARPKPIDYDASIISAD